MRLRRLFVLGCFIAWCFPALAVAQDASERLYEAAMKQGNAAYNQQDYPAAAKAYVAAIQSNPLGATAYRNLARSYFWASRYSAATLYYDHYLRLAPTAQDIAQIKAERRLSAERARDEVYTLPDSQRMALEALGRELGAGHAYTSGGGGAWALYQTLLRTGYAEPALAQLRTRLARRLLDEFDATLMPAADQLTPRLDLEGWQLQAERLAAARRIADDPALIDILGRRSTAVEAAIAMLTSQWENAAKLARLARTSNPDLDFLTWFEATSLIKAEKYDQALSLLDEFARTVSARDNQKLDYVRVLRGVALQRLNRHNDAADLYHQILTNSQ